MLRKLSEVTIGKRNLKEILDEYKNLFKNADLSYTDLRGINFNNIDLSGSDLRGTDLRHVNLSYTDLSNTNLSGANLVGANLVGVNLVGANLSKANLSEANLKGAYLSHTDLSEANLKSADLSHTDLSGANLKDAELSGAILNKVRYDHKTAFFAIQCPEKGSFIGYKKAKNKIIELLILEDSKRSSATSRTCRCDKAKVLSIESIDGKEKFTEVESNYNSNFIYKVGEIVKVDDFCENRWEECTTGIHFFITKQEAINY